MNIRYEKQKREQILKNTGRKLEFKKPKNKNFTKIQDQKIKEEEEEEEEEEEKG